MENKCVVCGAVIPEGRMICPNCDLVFRNPTTATEAARQGEIAHNIGYGKGYKDGIEKFAFVVIGMFNFYNDNDMFSKKLIVDSVLNLAKQFGVKIDDGK